MFTIGAWNATPADALITSGPTCGVPARGRITPSNPAPVAVRRIMPTFPGLVTPSSRKTLVGRFPRARTNSSSGVIRGASTSATTPWSCLPFPASHFTRLAVARSTGVPYRSAARRISCIELPVALSASTTFATDRLGSCSASSTGLRP